ncbi:MAG: hypothetical protein VYA17_10245 [Pseudomonadota bacterium]|nr:hypothetical protein [Pseudomonadota bacterium]
MPLKFKLKIFAMAIVITVFPALGGANAGTLENMERERAIMLNTLFSTEGTDAQRTQKLKISRERLIDMERMVIRDKSLVGKNTPAVRAAFENYDLTFLVHASLENNRSIMDHWLKEIGVSTETLMAARLGRR